MYEINHSKGTFHLEDVTLLLTDITGMISPLPTAEREKLIQTGVHYSEMLPLEYKPSKEYLTQYYHALNNFSNEVAEAVVIVSEKIYRKLGGKTVLVSLARAGTPIGVLIKRYLQRKYYVDIPHYTISIVRGRGIDVAAMRFILKRHKVEDIQFIDGWTGKGAILDELYAATQDFIQIYSQSKYMESLGHLPNKRNLLAVLADPANITDMCGTHEDIPIASSFLNSTVCGLMSRTIMPANQNEDEYHGVAFYNDLRHEDKTYEFIERIEQSIMLTNENILYQKSKDIMQTCPYQESECSDSTGIDEVYAIAKKFSISNINFIKPSIGEATRVLLRRVPDTILIAEDVELKYIAHLIQLAEEKGVPIVRFPLRRYKACGIIRALDL